MQASKSQGSLPSGSRCLRRLSGEAFRAHLSTLSCFCWRSPPFPHCGQGSRSWCRGESITLHTLVVKVYDPLHPGGSKERGQAPRCGYPPGVRTPKSSRAAGSKLAVLVDGCTRRHYEEGPLDEKCGARLTRAPLEESEQAPLGVHPKSTSHLAPQCTGGVTGLPSKGAALEPKCPHVLRCSLSVPCLSVVPCEAGSIRLHEPASDGLEVDPTCPCLLSIRRLGCGSRADPCPP